MLNNTIKLTLILSSLIISSITYAATYKKVCEECNSLNTFELKAQTITYLKRGTNYVLLASFQNEKIYYLKTKKRQLLKVLQK